jgi:phosphorylcholine metabolism protein LicD
MTTWKSEASSEKLPNVINITDQINALAHESFEEMIKAWETENQEIVATFNELDYWYHNAKNLNEKYKEAKKMEIFFEKMDTCMHNTNGLITSWDTYKDQQYHELKAQLDDLE